jgi:hypothetical protein
MPKIIILLFTLLLLSCDKDSPAEKKNEKNEKKNGFDFHFEYGDYPSDISVSKTATGAVAKLELTTSNKSSTNKGDSVALEANLSEEEWQGFANALQKIGVMEWERIYRKKPRHLIERPEWQVEIIFPGNAEFGSRGYSAYPPNWDEFMKLMTGIKRRISQELESRLQREYEKKFKKPITEQELSTEHIQFYLELSNKTTVNSVSHIIITRTATGAIAYYSIDRYGYGPKEGVKLSTENWLEFVKVLYESPFMKWEKEYGKMRDQVLFNDTYHLVIYNSDNVKPQSYSGYNKYPPNWDEFIKMINYIRAKVKKDSATVEVENKLKAGYKKRFGKPISDFELYARSMKFHAFSSLLDKAIDINLDRTATGTLIEYTVGRDEKGALLKAELSMEEWMDFLNNLQLCPTNNRKTKWDALDMCCRKKNDYAILDLSNLYLIVESSGNTDVFDISLRDLCVPKWDEFMKIVNGRKPAQYSDSYLLRY